MGKPVFDPNQPFEPVVQAEKPAFDPSQPFEPVAVDKMGMGKAALIQGEAGASLGLRPVVAGIGAGAGGFSGTKGSFGEKLTAAKDAFLQGRSEANEEQNQASKDHPYISTAANIVGSLLTLPALPAKGLAGAVKLGAGLGAAQAAGSANSLGEAAIDVGGGAVIGGAAFGAGKALSKGVSAVADSEIGQKVKDFAKKTLLAVPSELTGVADKEVEAYALRADKVNKIIQESGGDPTLAARHMKDNIINDVDRARKSLNSQISTALEQAPKDKVIDTSPIQKTLDEFKSRLNPIYDDDQIAKIKELQGKIKSVSQDGKMNIQDLQDTKQHLYDVASGAYKQGSRFFNIGSDVANAAKSAAGSTKKLLDQFGPQEIVNANRQLAQLHDIEDSVGRSLLDVNKPDSALYAVGSGVRNKNSESLQRLGDFTGNDYLSGLSDMSAARTFNNPALLPEIKTGRALLAPVVGTSIGGAAGAFFGGPAGAFMGGKIGAGVGTIFSSPKALKLAIDTGRLSSQALSKVSQAFGASPGNIGELYQLLQSPQAQQILIKAMSNDNQAAASQDSGNSSDAMSRRLKLTK